MGGSGRSEVGSRKHGRCGGDERASPRGGANSRHAAFARRLLAASWILVSAALSSCGASQSPSSVIESTATNSLSSRTGQSAEYRLGSGDRLKLEVYGENDLSGEFDVTGAGALSLPLLGQTRVEGLTVTELETLLADRLRTYVRRPRVSVQVLNYRPFYIQGEVKKGGEYPYSNGLLVRDAVAKAGGYTYRAATDHVLIRHANDAAERQYSLDESIRVLPGDNIRVPQRFF